MCDNCNSCSKPREIDVSAVADAAVQILIQAQSMDSKVTALKLIEALMGKGNLKLAHWKKPPENLALKSQVEHVVANLLIGGQLREDFHFTPYNTISYVLPGRTPIRKPLMLNVPEAPRGIKRKKKAILYDVDDDSS